MFLNFKVLNFFMPGIKYREMLKSLFKKPVFSVKDFSAKGVPPAYARKKLHLLEKRKIINRIERGKYTAYDDPLLVAPYISLPSYLSLWTALSMHGFTEQIPFNIEVVTSRKRFSRKIDFLGTKIIFYVVKPKAMFGYNYLIRKEVRIPFASIEKTVIDALYLKRIPINELSNAIKKCDKKKLSDYAEMLGDRRVIKKIKEVTKC